MWVELLQLLTVTSLLERHCVSPAPTAFAEIISLSIRPDTAILQVPPEETVVEPILLPFLYNVIVAEDTDE